MISLSDINFSNATELCHIMKKYGSDKGLGWHNYTLIYDKLFSKFIDKNINIFEVGLGTNNTDVPSNMGPNGKPGASLYGWREYFKNADVYGADVDTRILFESENIQTYFVDQLNKDTIDNLWSKIPVEFDVIIDDGLHTFEANMSFLENSFHKLKKDGIYIIEDIVESKKYQFDEKLKSLGYTYQILSIPNPSNNHDNVLGIIYK
jgi:hypothetical protein